jgi:hypothetical protein
LVILLISIPVTGVFRSVHWLRENK